MHTPADKVWQNFSFPGRYQCRNPPPAGKHLLWAWPAWLSSSSPRSRSTPHTPADAAAAAAAADNDEMPVGCSGLMSEKLSQLLMAAAGCIVQFNMVEQRVSMPPLFLFRGIIEPTRFEELTCQSCVQITSGEDSLERKVHVGVESRLRAG